jgi:hypothetical protein
MLNKKGISGTEYRQILKENNMSLVLGTTTPGSKAYYTDLSCLSLIASDGSPFDCSDCFIVQIQWKNHSNIAANFMNKLNKKKQ